MNAQVRNVGPHTDQYNLSPKSEWRKLSTMSQIYSGYQVSCAMTLCMLQINVSDLIQIHIGIVKMSEILWFSSYDIICIYGGSQSAQY